MKVLFYAYPMIGQNYGGLQLQITNTFTELVKLGIEVKLFDPWNDRIEDYDVFHSFYLGDLSVLPLVKRAKELGKLVVMSTVYNSALDYRKEKISYALSSIHSSLFSSKRVQKEIVQNVDYFIALSEFEKQRILDIFKIPTRKVIVIPNGISTNFFSKDMEDNLFEKKYGMKGFVLHVGQFTRNKNQIAIIEAMKDMKEKLVMIGQPVEMDYYNECQNRLTENMSILETLENGSSELVDLYKAAGLFILPSFREAYPLTVLEAGITGNKMLITKNCMLDKEDRLFDIEWINPTDITNIKKWIEKNRNYTKKRLESEKIAQFKWKTVAEELIKVYRMDCNGISQKNI